MEARLSSVCNQGLMIILVLLVLSRQCESIQTEETTLMTLNDTTNNATNTILDFENGVQGYLNISLAVVIPLLTFLRESNNQTSTLCLSSTIRADNNGSSRTCIKAEVKSQVVSSARFIVLETTSGSSDVNAASEIYWTRLPLFYSNSNLTLVVFAPEKITRRPNAVVASLSLDCASQTSGLLCLDSLRPCDFSLCNARNTLRCQDIGRTNVCLCKENSFGETCQHVLPPTPKTRPIFPREPNFPCDLQPCKFGTCINQGRRNSFTCLCNTGYRGTTCSIPTIKKNTGSTFSRSTVNTIVIPVVSVVAAVIGIVLLIARYYKKRSQARKQRLELARAAVASNATQLNQQERTTETTETPMWATQTEPIPSSRLEPTVYDPPSQPHIGNPSVEYWNKSAHKPGDDAESNVGLNLPPTYEAVVPSHDINAQKK